MSGQDDAKLNSLLRTWAPGSVATQGWLDSRGIYRQLADRYVRSGWLERIARGAYVRAGDTVGWLGGVYGIQAEGNPSVHPGGKTALNLLGFGHFVPGSREVVWIYGPPRTKLPAWFVQQPWNVDVRYKATELFVDPDVSLTQREVERLELVVASPERAILEVLHGVPAETSVEEAVALMEGLTTARPAEFQRLLESCRSVKVKRLFGLLAEHVGHPWVERLELSRVDLGSGKRVLGGGGHWYPSYRLSLPEPIERENGAP